MHVTFLWDVTWPSLLANTVLGVFAASCCAQIARRNGLRCWPWVLLGLLTNLLGVLLMVVYVRVLRARRSGAT